MSPIVKAAQEYKSVERRYSMAQQEMAMDVACYLIRERSCTKVTFQNLGDGYLVIAEGYSVDEDMRQAVKFAKGAGL